MSHAHSLGYSSVASPIRERAGGRQRFAGDSSSGAGVPATKPLYEAILEGIVCLIMLGRFWKPGPLAGGMSSGPSSRYGISHLVRRPPEGCRLENLWWGRVGKTCRCDDLRRAYCLL